MTSVLGAPRQIAYAVPDLAVSTVDVWSTALRAGPFVVAEHVALSRCEIDGRPGEFDHSSAYGQWGDVMVELIVEHQSPRIGSASGVHHVAFMVTSLSSGIDLCRARGWPVLLDATTRHGQRFVMCDARQDLGHLVEMYEESDVLREFYAHVRRLAERPTDDAIDPCPINP